MLIVDAVLRSHHIDLLTTFEAAREDSREGNQSDRRGALFLSAGHNIVESRRDWLHFCHISYCWHVNSILAYYSRFTELVPLFLSLGVGRGRLFAQECRAHKLKFTLLSLRGVREMLHYHT
jgi:hypothetical protein